MNHDPIAHLQITATHQREGRQRRNRPGRLALPRSLRTARRRRLWAPGTGLGRSTPRLPATAAHPSAILSE